MNPLTLQNFRNKQALLVLGTVFLAMLSACSSDRALEEPDSDPTSIVDADVVDPVVVDPVVVDPDMVERGFQIRSSVVNLDLLEGDQTGLSIPLSLTRANGHNKVVRLEIRGLTQEDVSFVTSSFSPQDLTLSEDESEAILKLSIANAPIAAQQRQFIIIANDGENIDSIRITVNVIPTSAPDVYLLAGQSNMEGYSGFGTRDSSVGGLDEPSPRIKQLNVTENDSTNLFKIPSDFVSEAKNVEQPIISTALDPLHVPYERSFTGGPELQYIGLGLSFAKRALVNTTADIVLVPASWSGSAFCQNDAGPTGNWMPVESDNPALGNTLLYDRAVYRANLAIQESGGVFRGILWHQGESEANDPDCAALYQENMTRLADAMRANILPVGSNSLRRTPSRTVIPFVVGTMSRGADERQDLSDYWPAKQLIDDVHRRFPDFVEAGAVSVHDDLVPPAYPCGNSSCIHFGPEALREMGHRYYEALQNVLNTEDSVQ